MFLRSISADRSWFFSGWSTIKSGRWFLTGQVVLWLSVREPRTGTGYPKLPCPNVVLGDRLRCHVHRRQRAFLQFYHE